MRRITYFCDYCDNDFEINPTETQIVHFGDEDFRLDFCDDMCEGLFQDDCEHHTVETEGLESICYDCGLIVSHPEL